MTVLNVFGGSTNVNTSQTGVCASCAKSVGPKHIYYAIRFIGPRVVSLARHYYHHEVNPWSLGYELLAN